ncbi:proprotein convertase P-domain-containing protein [Photobacterium indicum]|uniref:Peptidase M36 n=1 Tax=Photobacterium indicum TaxID=81447 RepID=A0A2T3LFB0_9GAMM|nr:proprotein convertase P-domain-containing protein [Photobacterium indicum]PSV50064.1 peptidase M36 [Photobacterium indicum]
MKKHLLALLLPIVGSYCSAPLASMIDFPLDPFYVTSSDEAKQLLAQRYTLTGLVNESVSTSLLSTQYRFYQGFANAVACSSSVVVTVDRNTKEVMQIYTHLLDESECQSAKEDNRAIDLDTPEQTYGPHVTAGNVKQIVTTSLNVFDPDPLTALEDTTLEYSDVISNAAYSLYSDIEVTEVAGTRYLENSRVRAVDVRAFDLDGDGTLEADVSQQGIITSASDFTIERDIRDYENKHTQFLDTMAFYHIDKSVQYLQQLGFDIVSEKPVQFDAFFGNKDNSTAYLAQNVIVFGNGVSADAEDADVILHELGHMINFSLVKRWRDGDTGAIGEGLGDYWAASSRYRSNKTFQPDTVFRWDGINTSKTSTRILNDTEARYLPGASYPAHVVRNGSNVDQLWSTPLFQVLKLAIAEHGEPAHEHIDRIIWEGIAALGGGVTMPDAALSIVKAAERLYPQSNYSDLFVKQFKAHNILTNAVAFYAPQFLMIKDGKTKVTLDLFNLSGKNIHTFTGRFEQSDDVLSFDTALSSKKQQATITVKVPDSVQCGDAFTLNAETVTDFNNQQIPTKGEYSIPFIVCTPKLTHTPKVENSTLSDATSTEEGLGGNKIGVKSYLLTLADTAVLDNDFAVSLHIKHKRMSDLKITLTPPVGDREITLLAYDNIQQDEFNQQLMSRFNQQVNRLKGESLEGTWTLKVTDRAVGESGELVSWGIANISGYSKPETATDETNNNNNNGNNEATNSSSKSGGGSLGWLSLFMLVIIKLRKNTP